MAIDTNPVQLSFSIWIVLRFHNIFGLSSFFFFLLLLLFFISLFRSQFFSFYFTVACICSFFSGLFVLHLKLEILFCTPIHKHTLFSLTVHNFSRCCFQVCSFKLLRFVQQIKTHEKKGSTKDADFVHFVSSI